VPDDVRRLSREQARRIAVRAQLLDAQAPDDLLSVVDRLTFLQLDPTDAVAPSADLVAWSRLGSAYRPEQLRQALERNRTLFEHRGGESEPEPAALVRPMADLGLHLAAMAAWPLGEDRRRSWLRANDAFRRRVLDLLASCGPLPSRDVPDTAEVPWPSTGWTNNRNVTQLLEFLLASGEVAVAGRRGRQRVWDLAARVYPSDVAALGVAEARAVRDARRLRSLGVARPALVGNAGVPATIEGTPGSWRVDPEASAESFEGRTAVLSPFDRLVHDRVRLRELFDFEYSLEMYKPAGRRRWGYFALPVLHSDRLVGKVDAVADRKAGVLQVHQLHYDVPASRTPTAAVAAELEALAAWQGLEGVRYGDPLALGRRRAD